jgi:hypothetical protein
MNNYIEKDLIEHFKGKKNFSRKELFDFYLQFEPDLKEGTFGWRIYNLKDKNVIRSVKRGVYTVSDKPEYNPNITQKLYKIASTACKAFDALQYCVWNVDWLNNFTQHQFSLNYYILEVEKDLAESIFYTFKDNSFKNTFLIPDKSLIERYVVDHQEAVVISNLISRSPVQSVGYKRKEIKVPTLEKILVDVFADTDTFYFLHGIEKMYIFESAIKKYAIDFSKLFNYARRRGKHDELRQFLDKHLGEAVKDII